MADLTILYWRDIPAQVIAKAGRRRARRELDPRFQAAIDRAAMRAKLHRGDDYLNEWRRGAPSPCGDDLEAEAERAVARLEASFDAAALAALIANGGSAQNSDRN